jgi:hypothetical protein
MNTNERRGMWIIDDEFLNGVAAGGDAYIDTVTVPRDKPYYDIEMISEIALNRAEPRDLVTRFGVLRRAFNGARSPTHLLVSCGNLTVRRSPAGDDALPTEAHRDLWRQAFDGLTEVIPRLVAVPGNRDIAERSAAGPKSERFYRSFADHFRLNRDAPARPQDHPAAAVARVCLAGDATPSRAFAYVAVIGFDSNDGEYKRDLVENHGQIAAAQLDASRRLVQTLVRTVAKNTPLYVVGVTHHNLLPTEDRLVAAGVDRDRLADRLRELECRAGCADGQISTLCAAHVMAAQDAAGSTSNGFGFLRHCLGARMSLIVHGNMRQREVATVTNTPLVPGQSPAAVAVVACPPFGKAPPTSGMARLRLNVWKGEAEVAFHHDIEAGERAPGMPVQVIHPLVSASRVSAAERRLYHRVRELVAGAAQADGGTADLGRFAAYVDDTWEETGYSALCSRDGTLPDLPFTRTARYHLLLLLRERRGRYDILLSNHTALRASPLGEWNTLLLPAFRDVRSLLEHLRDDVLRQVMDQAAELGNAEHVRRFEEAVDRILDNGGRPDDDVWVDQIREVAKTSKRKISPTNGCVTDYEYDLVTLLPLIGRPDSATIRDQQEASDYDTVMSWLNDLPTVRRVGEPPEGPRDISIEALRVGGGGLRWEPAVDMTDERNPAGWEAVRRVPPGAIWFPLPGDDEPPNELWQQCPSIVARNADVMTWVHGELVGRRAGATFPAELTMGTRSGGSTAIEFVGPQFPFAAPAGSGPAVAGSGPAVGGSGPAAPAGSTVEAMTRVEFMAGFDLDGQLAYDDRKVERVLLVRRDVPVWKGSRPVILVFDAGAYDEESVRRAAPDDAMGLLRPVQRYVLRAGLERAAELYDQVLTRLEDRWGFARIRKGDAPTAVAVTPPILEQLHEEDWEDERGARDFIVCDGNHRVVELVWNRGVVLPAIAVMGGPREPYYAKPFSRYEWQYTAGNVQDKTPDQPSKYAVRTVDLDALQPAAAALLRQRPESTRYRRYYRDLSTGFGNMGGQGGRYV